MAVSIYTKTILNIVAISICLLILVQNSDALHCYACNTYFQGRTYPPCVENYNRSGCYACLKTVTKVKLRDSGFISGWERVSETMSKYCVFHQNSQSLKEEGCYLQQNNGGYTERCFCYSDLCNQAGPSMHSATSWIYAVVSLGLVRAYLQR